MDNIMKISLTVLAVATLISCGLARRHNKPYVVNRWYAMQGYSETPYEDCGGDDGKVAKVEVVPCELDGGRCILHSGTNATIKIQFSSKVTSKNLRAVVHGIIGSIPLPFHIPQPNACLKSGVACPIEPSADYSYTAQIPVLKTYPRLSVKVKWELVDEENKDVACVIIPAKIK